MVTTKYYGRGWKEEGVKKEWTFSVKANRIIMKRRHDTIQMDDDDHLKGNGPPQRWT